MPKKSTSTQKEKQPKKQKQKVVGRNINFFSYMLASEKDVNAAKELLKN